MHHLAGVPGVALASRRGRDELRCITSRTEHHHATGHVRCNACCSSMYSYRLTRQVGPCWRVRTHRCLRRSAMPAPQGPRLRCAWAPGARSRPTVSRSSRGATRCRQALPSVSRRLHAETASALAVHADFPFGSAIQPSRFSNSHCAIHCTIHWTIIFYKVNQPAATYSESSTT